MMVRKSPIQVWSPAGLPATLFTSPGRSGRTIRAAILLATLLRMLAGMMFPWNGSRVVTPFTLRELDGLKIAPSMTGRPSASTVVPTCLPVSSALKSPALKASVGVVFP